VLVIEDDEYLGESTIAWLREVCQVSPRLATNLQEARRCLDEKLPDAILCDNGLPDGRGVEFLPSVKEQHPEVTCILWSGAFTREEREAASSLDGCYDKGLRCMDDIRAQLANISTQ
jgi:response regulator of citrate/malate metabolism